METEPRLAQSSLDLVSVRRGLVTAVSLTIGTLGTVWAGVRTSGTMWAIVVGVDDHQAFEADETGGTSRSRSSRPSACGNSPSATGPFPTSASGFLLGHDRRTTGVGAVRAVVTDRPLLGRRPGSFLPTEDGREINERLRGLLTDAGTPWASRLVLYGVSDEGGSDGRRACRDRATGCGCPCRS